MDDLKLIENWLKKVVIDLGLCPFAYEVFKHKQILFELTDFRKAEHLVELFSACKEKILNEKVQETTALIIFSSGLENFQDFLDVYNSLESFLTQLPRGEEIQMANFHPNYQFANTHQEDLSNYTNRSPLPIIHLLKVVDVSAAIDSHPDIDSVPTKNIKTIENLGITGIEQLMRNLHA